jgi:hypothetical protein
VVADSYHNSMLLPLLHPADHLLLRCCCLLLPLLSPSAQTGEPSLEEATAFAKAIHEKYPGKLLAYNCSPSFNWKKKLDDATIAKFQATLGGLGYKFQVGDCWVMVQGRVCYDYQGLTRRQYSRFSQATAQSQSSAVC